MGAIDQGTSSSRFLVFDSQTSEVVAQHQVEIIQVFPKEGWVEQDPMEILGSVKECMDIAVKDLDDPGLIKAVGITNQRETTVVWDKVII